MSQTSIQQLYIGYFGRAGDPAGENYWLTQEAAGTSFQTIATQFAVQSETTTLYPILTTPLLLRTDATAQANFINSVYTNLFGHAADSTGLTYWQGQLAAGANPGLMIAQIISGAAGADVTVMTNKATVAQNYTNAVIQAVPTVTWNANADTTQSRSIIATVTADPATVTAAGPRISAAITSDQSGNTGVTGATLTLTAAADTFSPTQTGASQTTANNDTIRGLVAGDFASADSVNGGGGFDTLNALGAAVTIAPVLQSVESVNIDPTASITYDGSATTGAQVIGLIGGTLGGTTGWTLTVSNVALSVNGAMANNTAGITDNLLMKYNGTSGSTDQATLVLTNNSQGGTYTADGVETLNVQSNGTTGNKLGALAGTSLVTVNISGSNALTLTDTNTAITLYDGTSATGALTITTGALAAASKVNGGSGADTLNSSASAKAITMNGGAGNDTLIYNGAVAKNNETGGSGVDAFQTKAGGLTWVAAGDVASSSTLVTDLDVVVDYTAGEQIKLTASGTTLATLTGTQLATAAGKADLLAAVNYVAGQVAATTKTVAFAFGSDEYIYQDNAGAGTFDAGDGLLKLTGAATTFVAGDLQLT